MMSNKANTFDILLGRRLRAVRRSRRFNQQRVGKYLGITFQQIQKYETGANRLPVEYLIRLCFLYHIPPTALIPTDSLLPTTLAGSRAIGFRGRSTRRINNAGADAGRPNPAGRPNDRTIPEGCHELPQTLPNELRVLERALADLQFAATVTETLDRREAARCIERLDLIREQVADLVRFIESRVRASP